jgi:glycosyltransferase involved in cell wall biosynthesis
MVMSKLRALLRPHHRDKLSTALSKLASNRSSGASNNKNVSNAYLLVISHDAHLAGAQRFLLSILAEWKRRQPFPIRVVCVGSGVLRKEFEQLFPTLVLEDFKSAAARNAALVDFIGDAPRAIYSNTVVNGPLLEQLRALGAPILSHCHELQASIERWASGKIMATTLTNSDFFISAAEAIARNLYVRHQVPRDRLRVVYASIDFWMANDAPSEQELAAMRSELGIVENEVVVFGCGTTDWRKGPDLFLAVALVACAQEPKLKFIWIGGEESPPAYQSKISASGLDGRVRFIGNRPNARRYFYVGGLFALTSREDPCALVALEAANAYLPVVSFESSGDIPQVLGVDCGAVVPFEDTQAFADAVLTLSKSSAQRRSAGKAGYERVRQHHGSESAARAIEETISQAIQLPHKALGQLPGSPLVSVVIPNYNHVKFLKRRLASVADQSLRDFEIIVLDDASTDDSRKLLEEFVASDSRARLLCNETNSGSTFKQWRKGLAIAQGKYIWIAESDDSADRRFLERTVTELERDSSLTVAHTHSTMIDIDGKALGRPDAWVNDLAHGRWNADFKVDGIDEIRGYLSQKNTIPNASAVVFRNFPGIESLVDDGMRLCADWLFWIRLLARGRYAFIAKELNDWRQSSSNARTRPPGVLEWEEGQQILAEVADLLNLSQAKRAEVVSRFHQRCVEWSGGLVQ